MSSYDETLVRWGLHHLLDNSEYQQQQEDEAFARSLQEQLYSVEIPADESHCCCHGEPQIGDYFDSYSSSGQHRHQEQQVVEEERRSEASAAHSPAADPQETMGSRYDSRENENDEAIAVVLSEELANVDGEVGRRLTHMESIPHVPRINREIPSADDASLDHERLLERLQVYGLSEHKISGDGNCQFRALSDQFYRTPDHHMFVRKEVVKQLKSDPEPYEGYVPMQYGDYVKKMGKSGEWGDHVTLQAAADAYGMKICLITSFRDTCIIDIVPKEFKSERVIFLSFWAEVHYNSVYPEGENPPMSSYSARKKRHWFSFWHW